MIKVLLLVLLALMLSEYLQFSEGVHHYQQAHAHLVEGGCEEYRRCCGCGNPGDNSDWQQQPEKPEYLRFAVCEVRPNPSKPHLNDSVTGQVHFRQMSEDSSTQIAVHLRGFDPEDDTTYHGFHIHAQGSIAAGCESAGAHYNPFGTLHGSPLNDRDNRHVGDLGNVFESSDGTVFTYFSDDLISLSGPQSVMGRAIVVHQKKDDLGRGGDAESTKTGNAGARIACCIIAATDGQFWGAN